MDKIAIIGGTGVYDPKILDATEALAVTTPYGEVAAVAGQYEGRAVVFLNRHGASHAVPPHRVNYRAIVWSLRELGVERVLATAAVGSLNQQMAPGHFVLPDQFLEFTKARLTTFFDGGERGVVHTDMTEPYCPTLRRLLAKTAVDLGLTCHNGATYVTTEGPRFETPAEIRMFQQWGGDLVGMTSFPEVALARELGLCYATVAMVTNFAAGISATPLTHEEVLTTMAAHSANLKKLLLAVLPRLEDDKTCQCRAAVQEPVTAQS